MASAFQTSTFLFTTFLWLVWVCVREGFASTQHCQVSVGRYGGNPALHKSCWHLWIGRDHSMPVWDLTALSWKPAAAVPSRFGFRHKRKEEMKKSSYLWISFSWNSLIQYRAISGPGKLALFSRNAFVMISTIDAHIQFFVNWIFGRGQVRQ